MNTTATATNLRTVARHWTDLHDALGQPAIVNGFGQGLRGYLAALEEADPATTALGHYQTLTTIRDAAGRTIGYRCTHCGDVDPGHSHPAGEDRDPGQLGQRPVPIRLLIADTMRAVEAALTACADDIARQVQRAPMAMPSARRATYASEREARVSYEDRQRLAVLARADLADPRRWRHTGRRNAVRAALWLCARVEFRAGPCRPIEAGQAKRIGVVAAGAAERVERALDIAAQSRTLAQRCACGGEIDMHGGEGRAPVAHCNGCGRIWTEAEVFAA